MESLDSFLVTALEVLLQHVHASLHGPHSEMVQEPRALPSPVKTNVIEFESAFPGIGPTLMSWTVAEQTPGTLEDTNNAAEEEYPICQIT